LAKERQEYLDCRLTIWRRLAVSAEERRSKKRSKKRSSRQKKGGAVPASQKRGRRLPMSAAAMLIPRLTWKMDKKSGKKPSPEMLDCASISPTENLGRPKNPKERKKTLRVQRKKEKKGLKCLVHCLVVIGQEMVSLSRLYLAVSHEKAIYVMTSNVWLFRSSVELDNIDVVQQSMDLSMDLLTCLSASQTRSNDRESQPQ
jgi:hypothetical protein